VGCGFPPRYVVKRTVASDSAELVAGRQSHKKRPHEPCAPFFVMFNVKKYVLSVVCPSADLSGFM
jgi:hypothetical protein